MKRCVKLLAYRAPSSFFADGLRVSLPSGYTRSLHKEIYGTPEKNKKRARKREYSLCINNDADRQLLRLLYKQ